MFERFTDRARRVIVLAQDEAKALDHDYIGTEHILLGLIHEGDGIAGRMLLNLGIGLDDARKAAAEMVPPIVTPAGHIPFSIRGKKVLELALREAVGIGHNYIGTEHILLGIIRLGEGRAVKLLEGRKVALDRVRQDVILALAEREPLMAASLSMLSSMENLLETPQPHERKLTAAIVEKFDPDEAPNPELRLKLEEYNAELDNLARAGRELRRQIRSV